MCIEERLQEIKNHIKLYGISLKDTMWLIEQLEKLLSEKKNDNLI